MPSSGSPGSPGSQGIEIAPMRPEDWALVRRIYIEGIQTGHATFETEAPTWETWDRAHRSDCRLIARDGDSILGWAAVSPVSGRCVYGGVAEVSVYVAERARGRGAGRALLAALIQESERCGIWTLQAGIFPENEASVGLHRRLGFREVGRRERIGKMDGSWRDVLLMERRSARVGAE
jgi:L-amino acid N-acyltransferase YncA